MKTSVREFGAHDGFWPLTSTAGGALPSAGITQMLKSPICDVNAIHLPSGDQSGSVGFGAPAVLLSVAGFQHYTRLGYFTSPDGFLGYVLCALAFIAAVVFIPTAR